MIMVKN